MKIKFIFLLSLFLSCSAFAVQANSVHLFERLDFDQPPDDSGSGALSLVSWDSNTSVLWNYDLGKITGHIHGRATSISPDGKMAGVDYDPGSNDIKSFYLVDILNNKSVIRETFNSGGFSSNNQYIGGNTRFNAAILDAHTGKVILQTKTQASFRGWFFSSDATEVLYPIKKEDEDNEEYSIYNLKTGTQRCDIPHASYPLFSKDDSKIITSKYEHPVILDRSTCKALPIQLPEVAGLADFNRDASQALATTLHSDEPVDALGGFFWFDLKTGKVIKAWDYAYGNFSDDTTKIAISVIKDQPANSQQDDYKDIEIYDTKTHKLLQVIQNVLADTKISGDFKWLTYPNEKNKSTIIQSVEDGSKVEIPGFLTSDGFLYDGSYLTTKVSAVGTTLWKITK